MILLDTNVVSELFHPVPAMAVSQWLNSQPLETLYLSTMTVGELRAGEALLPMGKRRAALHERLEKQVLPLFAGRILPFDMACTSAYAKVLATARHAGSGIETADALIAAVALGHGFQVATRDVHPFRAAGLTVINPWQTQDGQ